jgi:flagellar hook-basal body complex protein FliE
MTVEPIVPDIAQSSAPRSGAADGGAFATALDAVGTLLDGAGRSEDLYANGLGSLQSAVIERAQADVALQIATAAAQRGVQAMQSILNMQV